MSKFFSLIIQHLTKEKDIQRFFLMGILSNAINFSVYYWLISCNVNLSFSSILSYIAGLISSFHLSRVWVFGQQFGFSFKKALGFIIIYIFGAVWMTGIIHLLVENYEFNYKFAWLFGAGLAFLNNFLGLKFLIYNLKGKYIVK